MYEALFSELGVGGLTLKNRLIMAPTYLGYAGDGGTVSPMLLDHYRLMAKSGVAMVVVENCTPDCGEACMQMVMTGRPAFCVQWPPEKMKAWKAKFV